MTVQVRQAHHLTHGFQQAVQRAAAIQPQLLPAVQLAPNSNRLSRELQP